jgi:hypothetical protein
MAEIPAPTLIGVKRVIVSCETAGLTSDERQAFCAQLVKKAATLTALPVSLAAPKDLDRTDLARLSEQLLLRVEASATSADHERKTIALTVAPVRTAVRMAPVPPIKSSVSFVKIGRAWMIQGPIDGFIKLLGSGPHRLHQPIRADQ